MRRVILILATAWSVAGAPAFCRAGIWVECCSHESQPSTLVEKPECSSADGGCPDPQPAQGPVERRCASCVFACGGVAKLTDELTTACGLPPIQISVDPETLFTNDAGFVSVSGFVDRSDPPGRPFPRSDIPLLI